MAARPKITSNTNPPNIQPKAIKPVDKSVNFLPPCLAGRSLI